MTAPPHPAQMAPDGAIAQVPERVAEPPLFWLLPGSYVTPLSGDDAGQLYLITGMIQRGRMNNTSVYLRHVVTGERGWAQPWELAPADAPDAG